jgi:Mannosylglycerate hydrolase MGH1-like glycoside hydrolase domain
MEESMAQTEEQRRLAAASANAVPWKKWGPYLSERQWGTVREDYSADGNAWDYFTHDQARSRAYRWGEDGLAGVSDDHQVMCFALAMWNGKDPILKERLFGLTNSEGNHGEDVKEYYFYLDSTPTHSYMKYLYKYPQAAYPYADLIETSRKRGRGAPEYELLDTGVFNEDKYFDVFVEYAKAGAEDMGIKISVANRGPEAATLHLLPTVWYRNTWMWSDAGSKPKLKGQQRKGFGVISTHHTDPIFLESLSDCRLYCEGDAPLLFTENESNNAKLFGTANSSPYVKDGFHNFVIHGQKDAVNPAMEGTKAAPHYTLKVGPGETKVVRLRLVRASKEIVGKPFDGFDELFAQRLKEADEFYDSITPAAVRTDPDRALVMRQALAGMLWSKQYFYYDLNLWLREHKVGPWCAQDLRDKVRNGEWFHMYNNDIISMPDKWEYPWYAAWDLAFHMLAFQSVDPDFAKSQLMLILRNDYLHPNGQIPAYEWNFGDTNPPVHAYATMQIYMTDKERNNGQGDLEFLMYAFSKLLVNFTWWLNRKDREGNNLFEGGFLGLDNIGVFDRSAAVPGGGHLEQADGTAWMVFFSQQMLRISVELALHYPIFQEFVVKFFEHTMWIAGAMDRMGKAQDTMWDDEDGFFYDVLRMPDGKSLRMKVRSMVGLLPLTAVAIFEDDLLEKLPTFRKHAGEFMMRHPELAENLHMPAAQGLAGRRMLSTVNEDKLRRILTKMLDENEFFGPHGIRALSRYHVDHPFVFNMGGQESRVGYLPGDSDSGMFGGNSNWRGPVWMPVNFLLYVSLLRLGAYYGDTFKIECPTGSGKLMNLFEVGKVLGERLIGTFLKDSSGRRPVYGSAEKFQTDPHWRDNVLFFEYFHGDTGAGVGASHQTGWTGCIARIIQANGAFDAKDLVKHDAERRAVRLGQGLSAEDAEDTVTATVSTVVTEK